MVNSCDVKHKVVSNKNKPKPYHNILFQKEIHQIQFHEVFKDFICDFSVLQGVFILKWLCLFLIVQSGNEGNLHLFWTILKWFMTGNEIKSETIMVQRAMWRGSEDKRHWMECRERERERCFKWKRKQKKKETRLFGSRWHHRCSSSSDSGNIPGWSDAAHIMGDFLRLVLDRMTRSH